MQQNNDQGKVKKPSGGLIISNQKAKVLSKQQQTFNKLIKKIEKLRADHLSLKKSLDDKLEFYVKQILPVEQDVVASTKEAVKLLFGFFKNKKFLTKRQRQTLKGVIARMLDEVFSFEHDEPEEELKAIFKAVEGISYEKALEQDLDEMKGDLNSVLKKFGININFDDWHSGMTQEEIIQKAMNMRDRLDDHANGQNEKRATRKKTKKEREQEEKQKQLEEARAKNISSIYKQLAKILHPDLEQNEELKLEKEELMKQLTNAYENNDLHTLLQLELTWIQKEEHNPAMLTDDKLSIYNEVLKEQIRDLEQEILVTSEHPRYEPIQKFASFMELPESVNLKDQKKIMDMRKEILQLQIAKLKGTEKQALTMVKQFIYEFEQEEEYDADEDFSDDDDFYF